MARTTCMSTAPTPNRGEIWLIDFGTGVGAEIRKLRPAVVVSLNAIGRLPLRMVVPITDWKPPYASFPWMVELPADEVTGLIKRSAADAFQTKSVSLERCIRRIGRLTPARIVAVAEAIAGCIGAP